MTLNTSNIDPKVESSNLAIAPTTQSPMTALNAASGPKPTGDKAESSLNKKIDGTELIAGMSEVDGGVDPTATMETRRDDMGNDGVEAVSKSPVGEGLKKYSKVLGAAALILGVALPQPAGLIVGAIVGLKAAIVGFIGDKLSGGATNVGQIFKKNGQRDKDFRSENQRGERPNIIKNLLTKPDSSSGEATGPTSTSSAVTLEGSDVSQMA